MIFIFFWSKLYLHFSSFTPRMRKYFIQSQNDDLVKSWFKKNLCAHLSNYYQPIIIQLVQTISSNFGIVIRNILPVTQHWWVRNEINCWPCVLGQLLFFTCCRVWFLLNESMLISFLNSFFIITSISSCLFKPTPPLRNCFSFHWVKKTQTLRSSQRR